MARKPKRSHRAYKFHTYVISAHFFGQVQVFFFFTHCIVIKVRLESTWLLILEHIGTWTELGKEDLDDNFHQLLLEDTENH